MRITCPRCRGCGNVALGSKKVRVLSIVRKNPGLTALEIHLKTGERMYTENMHNRLRELVLLGMIQRKRGAHGEFVYFEDKGYLPL